MGCSSLHFICTYPMKSKIGHPSCTPLSRSPMPPFFKARWNESRDDEFASWGASRWYFHLGPDNWTLRQIVQYDSGIVLKYDGDHMEDRYGGLADKAFEQFDSGSPWEEISEQEFDERWLQLKAINRNE